MRSYKQRIARLSRQLLLADHLVTNMDLDTKLATMGAEGLPLYLPSQPAGARPRTPAHSWLWEGWSHLHLPPQPNGTASPGALPQRCFSAQAPTQVGPAVQGHLFLPPRAGVFIHCARPYSGTSSTEIPGVFNPGYSQRCISVVYFFRNLRSVAGEAR
jgi:hypothetical protein